MNTDFSSRTELLLGRRVMEALAECRVIVFGVGGVGGWCVEALARTGVGHLTMVDPDCVAASNINRQVMATLPTVGQPKAEVMRRRVLDINPAMEVDARIAGYTALTADDFDLNAYDYVIDAIDSLPDKALLIRRACLSRARLFSSMGAARKTDPRRIEVAEIWKVKGCPLAAALRRLFKRQGLYPARRFSCVFSAELHDNLGAAYNDEYLAAAAGGRHAGLPNGTLVQATATFGLVLASLVVADVERRCHEQEGQASPSSAPGI